MAAPLAAAPAPGFNPFDFSASAPASFNGQNVSNSFSVGTTTTANDTLTLNNNTWLSVELGTFPVGPNTILEFDVTATGNAEALAIGFERDFVESSADTIRFGGAENFGKAYHPPVLNGHTRSIRVNVGQMITNRNYNRITFIRDHDLAPSGSVSFSNVRLYQGTPNPTPNINWNDYPLAGFPVQNVSNQIVQGAVEGPRQSVALSNNSWAFVDVTGYTLTPNTVVSFDFLATGQQAEVYGLSFLNSLNENATRTVQIGGTQSYGVPFAPAAVVGTVSTYEIPVGQLLGNQSFRYLAFIRDADAPAPGAAFYSNIRIFEAGTPPVLPPKPSTDPLNFDAVTVLSHFGTIQTLPIHNNDIEPSAFSKSGTEITFTGNTWKVIDLDYSVTNNSVIEFDFRSTGTTPEIAAIGLQNKDYSAGIGDYKPAINNRTIQIIGSQSFGTVPVDPYVGGGAWQHYAFPLTSTTSLGNQKYLFLINDDDALSGTTSVSWRNIRIYEMGSIAAGALDFGSLNISSFPLQDVDSDRNSLLETGYALGLFGNTWKAVEVNKVIGPATVLHFEFESDGAQPEVSGLLFNKTTLNPTPATAFQLFGTQAFASNSAPAYTGNGAPQSYSLNVGALLPAGTYKYLTFINDADLVTGTNVKFRNVRWEN